ncbi:hypothetical protein WI88_27525 [Burkholderia ubonensis]|nr:hypothetical protein WI88_27525 [Burkholderia ubonensis]
MAENLGNDSRICSEVDLASSVRVSQDMTTEIRRRQPGCGRMFGYDVPDGRGSRERREWQLQLDEQISGSGMRRSSAAKIADQSPRDDRQKWQSEDRASLGTHHL